MSEMLTTLAIVVFFVVCIVILVAMGLQEANKEDQ